MNSIRRKWVPQSFFPVLAIGVMALALVSPTLSAAEDGILARGGKLYDKWYAVIDADKPEKSHDLYPADKKYAAKPASNWRCKECHGWDYQGKDGAYSKGSHFSGIKGVNGMAGADTSKITAVLKSDSHGYGSLMDNSDLEAISLFVSRGQVDMSQYIDAGTKMAKGDTVKGRNYYETLCVQCHGANGKKIEDMKPMGALANGNPWENLHKILNGQPDEEMPALRALDIQVAVDVLRYTQDLPEK
jgi:hypothetical protein